MSLYRVKQFGWALTTLFKKIDKDLINTYLTEDEIVLFNQLKHSDKHHCIRVCNDCLEMVESKNINIDKNKLAKVALLHDIGKITRHLNVFEKSIVVLLDKISKGKIKNYKKSKVIDIYYNHPTVGFNILEEYNYDDEFLDVVRYHHTKDKETNNKLLEVVSTCDDKN